MAELFVGAITGAVVGAVLNELIVLVKNVYRCEESCKNLLTTLESVKPLLDSVVQSSDPGNTTCQAWLVGLHTLLVKAKGLVEDCALEKSRFSFTFVKRPYLSSKIQDVDRRIKEKLSLEGILVALNIIQEINHKVTCPSMSSPMVDQVPPFEMQHVPSVLAKFENNLFKRLKEQVLSVPFNAPQTIGLKGRGGAGKTLLAKMVNNDEDIQRKYGAGSILWITIGHDVSVSSVYNRMGKFLDNGGRFESDFKGRDLEEQCTCLMEAFKKKRALVILDDVWEDSEKNHPMVYWLDVCKGDGSTTLITTRNDSVLNRARAMQKIEVESLSEGESWKLFSYHAFPPNTPLSREVNDIAKEVCNECKGLPLALAVIGGALWGKKDERDWKYALICLRGSESLVNSDTMEEELYRRLQFSYDVLKEDAKKCFLYFAAFPEDYKIPTKKLYSIWEAEGLFGSISVEDMLNTGRVYLTTLADRSLIDLDEDGGYAKIHDVLRDLAIRIIREAKPGEWASECQFEPGKVLKTLPKIKETTKRVSFVGTCVSILEPEMYIEGLNLQVCLLESSTFGSRSGISFIPEDFFLHTRHLLYLDLSYCQSLEKLPESIKELKSLTHLDLKWCVALKELPKSIKDLKSLVHLDLSFCMSLKELPESIKELKSLTHLDLKGCSSLKELPESIKELKSLTHLDLKWCVALKELPESIKELKSLTHLDLKWCEALKELPRSIKDLKSLVHLDLSFCMSLKELPESIKELKSLTHLDLKGCSSLKELPESIKELKSLTHLDLKWCEALKELPKSIKDLKSLVHLDLSFCMSLKELPESIKELKSLTHLDPKGCSSLKELPEIIKELKCLTHLYLSGCMSLKELVESIKELKSLTHLDLKWCEALKELPESIKELKSLTHLDLKGCMSLKELPESIKELKCLTHLYLSGCRSMKELPESITELKSLRHVDISECESLKEIPESIKELKSLTDLD